ncbi:MAG TPA: DksA/TraR family C4-type zinc finger protein [Paracoccaceae bacterium]|nr:DksA/TraR family C4-type zinc finger protein [Paracoccaceae bacterium]HMO71815.1 DksA/TraR family C4-type zinc finger protein [Paracoccaceae bacterium]
MAGGWVRDGAVEDQIEASLADELARLRARAAQPAGAGRDTCADCDEPIPAARRAALPGAVLCRDCQDLRDRRPTARGGINRRGSKDSQLK